MPGVEILRYQIMEALGRNFTDDEFGKMCFEFGIELDDIFTDTLKAEKELKAMTKAEVDAQLAKADPKTIKYKIDIPANRYDLLCLEGLSQALRVFLSNGENIPSYRIVKGAQTLQMKVLPETAQIRPFVVAAVLRNITFTPAMYDSFIELQEKLHNNICRKRTLVAIGTHDLDTIEGPFTYEALPPKDISFVPLQVVNPGDQHIERDAASIMEYYSQHPQLKHYLHIIRDSPVYPVIYDSKRRVLSMPPIINSNHSKITLSTRNVLVECTGTDLTKTKIVLNTVVSAFSQYCAEPFTVEPVEVTSGSTSTLYPDLSSWTLPASVDYINKAIGIQQTPAQIVTLLRRMGLHSVVSEDQKQIVVTVPPTRSDILHECDVMEDVAIAYGFNNIPFTLPEYSTTAGQSPVNKLTDQLRAELAQVGYTEIFTFSLCSRDENYKLLNKPEDGKAVTLLNPATVEFQVARTSLLPGMMKTLQHNKGKTNIPVRIFEVSDVVLKDNTSDVGASNHRRLIALYSAHTSAFEIIHGLLDRVMQALNIKLDAATGYSLQHSEDPSYMDKRRADVLYKGQRIGVFGVLSPLVHTNFDWPYPCSVLELDLRPFV